MDGMHSGWQALGSAIQSCAGRSQNPGIAAPGFRLVADQLGVPFERAPQDLRRLGRIEQQHCELFL